MAEQKEVLGKDVEIGKVYKSVSSNKLIKVLEKKDVDGVQVHYGFLVDKTKAKIGESIKLVEMVGYNGDDFDFIAKLTKKDELKEEKKEVKEEKDEPKEEKKESKKEEVKEVKEEKEVKEAKKEKVPKVNKSKEKKEMFDKVTAFIKSKYQGYKEGKGRITFKLGDIKVIWYKDCKFYSKEKLDGELYDKSKIHHIYAFEGNEKLIGYKE
jgi:hypothetical protein